jgi:hypothetical protein
MATTKTCTACKQTLPLSEFGASKGVANARSDCKKCNAEASKRSRQRGSERLACEWLAAAAEGGAIRVEGVPEALLAQLRQIRSKETSSKSPFSTTLNGVVPCGSYAVFD